MSWLRLLQSLGSKRSRTLAPEARTRGVPHRFQRPRRELQRLWPGTRRRHGLEEPIHFAERALPEASLPENYPQQAFAQSYSNKALT